MSDSRRRRKSQVSRGSDDLSDSYDDELNASKETQSEDHHDSEYDTAGTDSNSESQDGAQRESGDGQEEEKPAKKLDDDEDRRNPQYIPKRGTFYEHDDRTAEEAEDNAAETPPEREVKEKKVWKDKEDRWDHDRYNDEEQAPKSHEELIAVYGYDIRNEEGPPRARRRRRYGRGPNKYTRNWEDENAYGKPAGTPSTKTSRRVNRSGEDFPALNAKNKDTSVKAEEPVISSAWYNNKNKTPAKPQNFPPLQNQKENDKTKIDNKVNSEQNNTPRKKEVKMQMPIESPNGNINGNTSGNNVAVQDKTLPNTKMVPRENKRFSQENPTRSRGRGYKANQNNNIINKTSPPDNKMKGRGTIVNAVENKRISVPNMDEQQLVHEMKQVHVGDGSFHHARQNKQFYNQSSSQQRTTTGPAPRLQPPLQQPPIHSQQQPPQPPQQQPPQPPSQQPDTSGNRPKRYSSLRQRPPIAEGPAQQNYPPQPQQHGYYPTQAGNPRGVLDSQGYPPSHYEQPPPVAPATGPMNAQPVLSIPPPGAQPAGYAAPPPFLVPSPQFIPPQTAPPSLINYVPAPNGPPAFQNFQGYQSYNPAVQAAPPPPQELFQPQGCTYYNPAQQQQQQQQQQVVPLRRPKVAIPILPPPENQQSPPPGKGRGRNSLAQQNIAPRPGNVPQYEMQPQSQPQLQPPPQISEEKKPLAEPPQEPIMEAPKMMEPPQIETAQIPETPQIDEPKPVEPQLEAPPMRNFEPVESEPAKTEVSPPAEVAPPRESEKPVAEVAPPAEPIVDGATCLAKEIAAPLLPAENETECGATVAREGATVVEEAAA